MPRRTLVVDVLNDVALSNPSAPLPASRKRKASVGEVNTPKKRRSSGRQAEDVEHERTSVTTGTTSHLGRVKNLQATCETRRQAPKLSQEDDWTVEDSPDKGLPIDATSGGFSRTQANTKKSRARVIEVRVDNAKAPKMTASERPRRVPETKSTQKKALKPSEKTSGERVGNLGRPAKKSPVTTKHGLTDESNKILSDPNNRAEDKNEPIDYSTKINKGPNEAKASNDEENEQEDRERVRGDEGEHQSFNREQSADLQWRLLGKDKLWKEALEAAQVNRDYQEQCGSIKTRAMKTIEGLTKTATSISGQMLYRNGNDTLKTSLEGILESIEDKIKHLSKDNRPRETVQDAYLYAIPGLLSLLDQILNVPTFDKYESWNIRDLKLILLAQRVTIKLCERMTDWKVKPDTDVPITGRITRKVFPNLRDIARAFKIDLDRLTILQMIEEDYRTRQSDGRREASQRELREKKERDKKLSTQRIQEAIERNRLIQGVHKWPIQRVFQGSGNERPARVDSMPTTDWTVQETTALLEQVFHLANQARWRTLPVQDRYLDMLNTVLLQGKRPEVVRGKVLSLKPVLEEEYLRQLGMEGKEQDLPEWLATLD